MYEENAGQNMTVRIEIVMVKDTALYMHVFSLANIHTNTYPILLKVCILIETNVTSYQVVVGYSYHPMCHL